MGGIGTYDDWTGNVMPDADLRSLDPEAVRALRAKYALAFPDRADESKDWDDGVFLTKAGVLKRGKVTVAAAILLGKRSERLIPPSVRIRWRLADPGGGHSDERTFSGPIVLAAIQAASVIRNWSAEIGGESPRAVSAYRIASLEEAILNAFAHQDYSLGGTVEITERDGESVSVRSRGTFFGDPESFAEGRSVPSPVRNRYLREAMAKSGMVAGKGTGIRGMYLSQAHRHFPLPSYRIDDDYVSVTFHGIRYGDLPRVMDSVSGLDIGTLIDLDRIYTGRLVPERRMKSLIERGLADTEGGISRVIPGGSRGMSDRDAVLELMASGPISRADVAELLRSRASKPLTAEQIGVKATNLLQSMRKEGLIAKSGGSTKMATYWFPEGSRNGVREGASRWQRSRSSVMRLYNITEFWMLTMLYYNFTGKE